VELLTEQRLNGKDVPVHAIMAYRGVKVLFLTLALGVGARPCP
jgi:hypothetical protein